MKKLLCLLLILPLFVACSKDDDDNRTPTQDYTSLVLENKSNKDLPLIIIAYKSGDAYFTIKKILNFNIDSTTSEINIDEKYSNDIYMFISTYTSSTSYYKIINPLPITLKIKNEFKFTSTTKGILVMDINDPTQFPQ